MVILFLHIILLIVGFIFLIKGADIFVDGASSTAQNFKVSKMLIGLTIIAFGTSAPEFAVSMKALASGSTDMVLGNVIGSCITNSLLILGLAAVIHPVRVKVNTVKKELPLCLLFSTALVVLFLDIRLANGITNQISRSDGIIILLFFTIFLYYLISLTKRKKEMDEKEKPKFKLFTSLLLVIIGLLGIIFGSDLVVNHASGIAKLLGWSDRLIALTIIAIGTSLPELVTTIVSSRKKEQDLLIGNIIGSNIFNICVVLGIPVVIYGAVTPSSFHPVDLIMLVVSSLLLFVFAETNKTISKVQGFIMVAVYFIYYIIVFVV